MGMGMGMAMAVGVDMDMDVDVDMGMDVDVDVDVDVDADVDMGMDVDVDMGMDVDVDVDMGHGHGRGHGHGHGRGLEHGQRRRNRRLWRRLARAAKAVAGRPSAWPLPRMCRATRSRQGCAPRGAAGAELGRRQGVKGSEPCCAAMGCFELRSDSSFCWRSKREATELSEAVLACDRM